MFTNKDIETMSNGIIELIQNASKAKQLVIDNITQSCIDSYIKELQELNTRLSHHKTYEYEGFIIECYEHNGMYQSWLSHPDYSTKTFVFGNDPKDVDFTDFVRWVEYSIDDYIKDYKTDVMNIER